MQVTVEALIVALRGAADALEDWNPNVMESDPVPVEKEPAPEPAPAPKKEPKPEPKPEPAATDEPPAPWEAEETPPPQVEEVTAQDIVALYQEVAAQGKKVDMLALLSSFGVERVGELDDAGRAKLHAAIKEAAGL
jgi:outer membrane biosynthesis protein TonB